MIVKSPQSQARIIGALFFVVMLLWYIGCTMLDSLLYVPDYLSTVYPNRIKIHIAVLCELLEASAVMGITFLLFPFLKMRSYTLATSYMWFRIFETLMLIFALFSPLLLITLSQEYIQSGMTDASHFETIGLLLKETRTNWSFFIVGLFHPLAALPLYYFFFDTKLIPRFISAWGFIAALWILVDEMILESFGLGLGRVDGNLIAGSLMGLNEIVLGLWLIIKGFNKTAYDKLSGQAN